MDIFGNPANKDPVSPFVQLLWEKGNAFEHEVIEKLKIPFTDLSSLVFEAKEAATKEAMIRGDELIYSGRIRSGDLLGEPDLLRRQKHGYIAGDIKSGAGEEGASDLEDKKPKIHYAVQLALYTDILGQLGLLAERMPFVWDIHGEEIIYDLDIPQGKIKPTTLWSVYQDFLSKVASISSGEYHTLPAYSSICKLCHWRTACTKKLTETNDLTLIPELGRVKRDTMLAHIRNINELAEVDINSFIKGNKTVFSGIGPDTLRKFQSRAKMQVQPNARPYLTDIVNLPASEKEIFFDIETDPMQDVCYLHGFIEREKGDSGTEKYFSFFADEPTPEKEEQAFTAAWKYIRDSKPCMIFYYSKYERTIWRKLQSRYPHVASPEEIEEMFSPAHSVDLYFDVVKSKTEWPTRDYSIKTLAYYLGFSWRDSDPSGANSIEWYHRWIESKDKTIKQRILEYNEDDCIATRVLLDGIRDLKRLTV
jgi:uncharacterized protein